MEASLSAAHAPLTDRHRERLVDIACSTRSPGVLTTAASSRRPNASAGVSKADWSRRWGMRAIWARRVDVLVTDGIRYRMYAFEKDFAPVAYAKLARLKRSAGELSARLARP